MDKEKLRGNSSNRITERWLYSAHSLYHHADSRIDDADRLHIDTDEARVIIDPR